MTTRTDGQNPDGIATADVNLTNGKTTPSPDMHFAASDGKEFNILLVGETGVGKSTFINAFINYMTFQSLDDAINSEQIVSLIPSQFTVTDENYEEKLIVFGKDDNESRQAGASATQSARSYKIQAGNVVIRLIDTPGIGDTRGIKKDEDNFDKLLTVIGELQELHAICILLKPNNARLTVLFEYCIKQLLSRLQKSASENIVFVFTNSRSTFYRPGDTLTPLKRTLKDIESKPPNVKIPFNKSNVFCMDNEAFRFLIAKREGVTFSEQEKEDFSVSWNKSAQVCIALIEYIIKTKPHRIQDTVSVNEARRLILMLSTPLALISENIDANLRVLKKHRLIIEDSNKSIDSLKKKLYIPVIRLKVIELTQPRTVCTDTSCTETYTVEGAKSVHYKTLCHNPCYLSEVPKELVGSRLLYDCSSMKRGKCVFCGHSYLVHMHIYYITEKYDDKITDTSVDKNIKKTQTDVEKLRTIINELEQRREKYKVEKDMIQKSMAKFAHFLQNNVIAAYNDKYKEYIELLINREQSHGEYADKQLIDSYKKLIRTYQEHKDILDRNLAEQKQTNSELTAMVSAKEIIETVKDLYNLDLSGGEIREFYDKQNNIRKTEVLTKTEKTFDPTKISPSGLAFVGKTVRWFGLK